MKKQKLVICPKCGNRFYASATTPICPKCLLHIGYGEE